jgi:hypothetical protein
MAMALLRFPGSSCPKDALTGDGILDDYLVELDSHLLGSAKVRLLTLAEIKDHLQERKSEALAKTATETDAARIAVRDMGPARSCAEAQHAAIKRRFLRLAIPAGTVYLAVNLLFDALRDGPAGGVWTALRQGLLFAVMFGWWASIVLPRRLLPTADAGAEFIVGCSTTMRRFSYAIVLLLVAISVTGLGAALGVDTLDPFGWNQNEGIVLAALSVLNIRNVSEGIWSCRVDPQGFWIERWMGKERVLWTSVRSLRPLGETKSWIRRWSDWGKVQSLDYAKGDGSVGRFNVVPHAANAERFMLLLRSKIDSRDRLAENAAGQL